MEKLIKNTPPLSRPYTTFEINSRSRHLFDGSALDSLFLGGVPHPYEAWYQGNEKQTEILDTAGSITTAVVLRKTVTDRAQRASVSWWASYAGTVGLPIAEEPPNDPRLTQLTHTIEPSAANLVSKQTFGYDDTVPFNNQNNVKNYNFGNGIAGGLLRETRRTFVTDAGYTGTSVHLRTLALQISTFDGSGVERARSTIEYDNYTFEGPDCSLTLHCP